MALHQAPKDQVDWFGIKNDRFYTIKVDRNLNSVTVSYGKIGGKTTLNTKTHPNQEKALKVFYQTITKKTKDEFREFSLDDFQQHVKDVSSSSSSKQTKKVKQSLKRNIKHKAKNDVILCGNFGDELQMEDYEYLNW